MPSSQSIQDIDLTPMPGRTYFNITREWREEFIYFLLVDRFHDDSPRAPVKQAGRSRGVQVPDGFYGGKITGITQNLDYIAGLGCTSVWISPIFGNNPGAYHGYNINMVTPTPLPSPASSTLVRCWSPIMCPTGGATTM